ncbi:hypothetical protein UFOVP435_60 [uncultured Caudovirales phage]|uniref:Uncharacterized protein n=1 Tax=uncultured Caudovirales phage TaxID=2100421 RepID=A0A6J5MBH4_9CAUD|nr:hypothetical protein UFOVP435_60 [uncultured Caudovirales phage]
MYELEGEDCEALADMVDKYGYAEVLKYLAMLAGEHADYHASTNGYRPSLAAVEQSLSNALTEAADNYVADLGSISEL